MKNTRPKGRKGILADTFMHMSMSAVHPVTRVQREDLNRTVGYVRIEHGARSLDAETQRTRIKELARQKRIEIVHWNNDPTPEKLPPIEQRGYIKEVSLMHEYGCALLLVESWERISSNELNRILLLNQASQCGVVAMACDGTSNYMDYLQKISQNQVLLQRIEAQELSERIFRKDIPPVPPKSIGSWMSDEDKKRLSDRIRKLRIEGYSLSKMVKILYDEGFRTRQGNAWSIGTIGMIAAQVLPFPSEKRRRFMRAALK